MILDIKGTEGKDEPSFTLYVDGGKVGDYHAPSPPPLMFGARKDRKLNQNTFVGPKLKLERAKQHVRELDSLITGFYESNPYELVCNDDTQAGKSVFRLRVYKPVPASFSTIIGDVVHNLRSALDFLVCDLIRANGHTPGGHSGLLIKESSEKLEAGAMPKIKGVSPKAESRIFRMKRYRRWNSALFTLHRMDIFDKHNCIVPTASATFNVEARIQLPFGLDNGSFTIGKQIWHGGRLPNKICPVYDNVEIHRSPIGFNEKVQIEVHVAFGEGQILEGEPVLPSLLQFCELVERVMILAERTAL
ncbi:MAG: hypothetical protein ACAH06_02225 [Methylophilaceae bacterium]|uniref:hypothetical protein n=1 Tax=Methylibium sp. TaxID=2067992 RepID=UPI0035997F7F